jgi:hypothetical protein
VVVATYVIQHPAIGVPDEIIAPNKEKSRKDGNDPNGKVPFRVCFMRLVRVISVWSPFPGSFPQCVGDRCENCTKIVRSSERNLVGLPGEQTFSIL